MAKWLLGNFEKHTTHIYVQDENSQEFIKRTKDF